MERFPIGNNKDSEIGSSRIAAGESADDPIAGTLEALDRRLETIRKEQLAKNRSMLRALSSEQLREVERVTAAITGKVFREVANELKHSAAQGNAKRLSETVSLMLGLA